MDPLLFSQLLQVLGLLLSAAAGVAVVWLQARMKQRIDDTNNKVDGVHGAALQGKATAFQALARLDPSPGSQAAAQAAVQEVRAYEAAKAKAAPK